MSDTCQTLQAWSHQYFEVFRKAVQVFSEWYSAAQAAIIQPEILAQNVRTLRMGLSNSETELNKVVRDFQTNMDHFTAILAKLQTNRELRVAARDSNANRPYKVNSKSLKELKGRISEQITVQQDLKKDWEEHLKLQEELEAIAQTVMAEFSAKLGLLE